LRKISVLLILAFFLTGCATYKLQKSTTGPQGYLVSYDGYPLPEYTLGKDKTLPDLSLAKERFKRRRLPVENYYRQMDKIESRIREFLWEPPEMAAGFLWGVLRWPMTAVADYKYNHNLQYKAKIDRQDEEKEVLETARKEKVRKELDAYVAKDLSQESAGRGVVEAAPAETKSAAIPVQMQKEESKTETPAAVVPVQPEPAAKEASEIAAEQIAVKAALVAPAAAPVSAENQPVLGEELLPAKQMLEPPVAVITAKPVKGYSPLKVKFSGQKSFSKSGKIVAYLWDFGDGDTSAQKNPENTYWSTTFGPRNFTVTLTVRDQAGSVSSATSVIEVITR
jgi:PKD domain